uniref:Uncharacterized protein n=1 Tax=Malurus cyaneus samueli TaxID=2593467 RepID=A0A8C5UA62_9PASS
MKSFIGVPLTSFYGRFRHFLDIIDPRTLFVTEVRCARGYYGMADKCSDLWGRLWDGR